MNNLYQTGITVKHESGEEQIYFQCVAILGDNLGLNGILGFSESFSSNFYCRICKLTNAECQVLCSECPDLLRTPQNYKNDVDLQNQSKTGIRESCIWNRLEGYHVCKNMVVDLMHDLNEGACVYVMTQIVNHFIFDLKIFDLALLNFRLRIFDYGPLESSNKPPQLKLESAKNVRIKMSASETICLVRIFSFLAGDLIPNDNPAWQLYLKLRLIVQILTSSKIKYEDIPRLQKLIYDHHKQYQELFNKTLTPKFHFLTHYMKIILTLGPPIHYLLLARLFVTRLCDTNLNIEKVKVRQIFRIIGQTLFIR